MSIPVTCICGQQFMAQPHLAGQRVACPNCGNPLVIPASTKQASATADDAASVNIVSCQCGQSFKAPPHLAGKRVPCPSCGQPIDIPGVPSVAGSEPVLSAAASKPATKTGGAATGALPKRPSAAAPAESSAATEEPSEVDSEFGWDDALAAPVGAAPLDAFATGPAYVPRRVEAEPIQPMTMYAIWIGGGAVVLLVLLIVGHILWKAFASGDGETPVASPPAATAPAEPGPEPPATPDTSEPSEG